jgi:putative FmdB family regulatory protein
MPTYEYRCVACRKEFTRVESLVEHERSKVVCPECRSTNVERIFTPFYAKTVRKS